MSFGASHTICEPLTEHSRNVDAAHVISFVTTEILGRRLDLGDSSTSGQSMELADDCILQFLNYDDVRGDVTIIGSHRYK
jgi:hypothetical protein